MSPDKLRSLEDLSRQARDQSLEAVDEQRRQVEELENQSHELGQFNREYQHSVVGEEAVLPRMLEHRRAFVSRLTVKLEDLIEERESSRRTLAQRMAEHRRRSAQHAAIEGIYKRCLSEHEIRAIRQEQQQMDDAQRGLRTMQVTESRSADYEAVKQHSAEQLATERGE